MLSEISLEHVGFVTCNIPIFEAFWVDKLGFKKVWTSVIPQTKIKYLFGIDDTAICQRYEKDNVTLEIHQFAKTEIMRIDGFKKYGLNHICLHVKNREKFVKKYDIKAIIYEDKERKKNYFMRDYESNWIELRETL